MAANPPPALEVWPCNWAPYQVFLGLATQWRYGMAGATGLDYAAVPDAMRRFGVKKKRRQAVFDALRVMEAATLDCLHSKK